MNSNILNIIKNVFIGIVIILIIILLLFFRSKPKVITTDSDLVLLKRSYDSSQIVINSLNSKIKRDSSTILYLDSIAKMLTIKYNGQEKELDAIKVQKGKKNSVIKKYDVVEIEESFQSRYNDHLKTDSIVTISKNIGQEVLVDLDYYDILKKEIPVYDSIGILLNHKINNRDSVIAIQNSTLKDYNQILLNYSNQRDLMIKERNDSDHATKKQKTRTIISQIIAGLAIALYILK